MRTFVLVTATVAEQNSTAQSCSGIRKLKRGVKLPDFIQEYLEPLLTAPTSDWFTRGGSTTVILREQTQVTTWTFTEYKDDDLLDAVKHLTKEELLRDLKELLPLKDWK